ncbi:MAG: LacI family transcriptional regulator [Lachnospiraceae bacterium]|nr:LacI family transcriptional regulator [Lachnospiraceae bacterium]
MVTISQIAAEAKVSSALVSRVLNNKSGVSPENREKILAIIKKHNYVPNAIARSLVTQKTATIGVVIGTICDSFFFDFFDGIQDMAETLDYNVVFCSGRNNADIKAKYVDYFAQGRVDGIIAYGSRYQDLFFDILERFPFFVTVEGDLPGKDFNKVLVDNLDGAYRATTYLIEQGYQTIFHFTGDMDYSVSLERLDGFKKAMQDHGLSIDNAIITADFEEELAYKRMKKLIAKNKHPQACFAGADKGAFGIIRALTEAGLSTPGDVAVIGFDGDVPNSRDMVFPRLTTMRQPLFEMGKEAVRLLVRTIETPGIKPITTTFDTELVLGETT